MTFPRGTGVVIAVGIIVVAIVAFGGRLLITT